MTAGGGQVLVARHGHDARPRRIWIVNHYSTPPDQPWITRHFDLARQLVMKGHHVTIFASGFSHMTGRDDRLRRGQMFRRERFDGVEFVWLKTFPYRGNTWRRQVNMLTYLAVFLVVQTRWPAPDWTVGVTVHPFAALGAWIAARLRSARNMFEINDLWPQTLVDLGAMRVGSPGERLLRSIEAFLVRHADVTATLLPGTVDYLTEQGLPTDRVVYLPNGTDLEVFDDVAPDTARDPSVTSVLETVEGMRAAGRFVVGYTGAFGRVNRVDVIVEAGAYAERMAPGRVGVVLVGDGPERPELEAMVRGSAAVVLAPSVPKKAVSTVLRAFDAAVVHATATPVYKYGISFNKLFDYMAAARPIAFACDSAYDPVAATGAGVTVRPDDPEALAKAFLMLADASPDERARMGTAGRAYVEREHNISRLGETLESVVLRRKQA